MGIEEHVKMHNERWMNSLEDDRASNAAKLASPELLSVVKYDDGMLYIGIISENGNCVNVYKVSSNNLKTMIDTSKTDVTSSIREMCIKELEPIRTYRKAHNNGHLIRGSEQEMAMIAAKLALKQSSSIVQAEDTRAFVGQISNNGNHVNVYEINPAAIREAVPEYEPQNLSAALSSMKIGPQKVLVKTYSIKSLESSEYPEIDLRAWVIGNAYNGINRVCGATKYLSSDALENIEQMCAREKIVRLDFILEDKPIPNVKAANVEEAVKRSIDACIIYSPINGNGHEVMGHKVVRIGQNGESVDADLIAAINYFANNYKRK